MDVFAQQRTHHRATVLAVSQLACLGSHTVTGLLAAAGKQDLDWSADYRLFSQDRWDPQRLFDSVLAGTLEFIPPQAPLVVAMDDTLLRKIGATIPDVKYQRDPMSPPFRVNLVRGQRFLQISAMLPSSPEGPAAARAVPVRFQPAPSLPKPSRKDTETECVELQKLTKFYNLSTIGRHALAATREQLDRQEAGQARQLIVGVDGSYTNRTVLRDLPPRTTLIGRIRKDAQLFHPPREDQQPDRGRRRTYGQPVPTPQQVRQDESIPWRTVDAFAAGRMHCFRIKTIAPVLWPKAGGHLPLRLVVIAPLGYRLRKGDKLLYRQPAYLICTDPEMTVEQLLQAYLWRWGIEVNHRDEKQLIGAGEAQLHSLYSARRGPIFAVACYAKLLLAGARHYGPDATQANLALPKWRRQRPRGRVTTGDLLREVRRNLWADTLRRAERDFGGFATRPTANTTGLKMACSLAGAVDHVATG